MKWAFVNICTILFEYLFIRLILVSKKVMSLMNFVIVNVFICSYYQM